MNEVRRTRFQGAAAHKMQLRANYYSWENKNMCSFGMCDAVVVLLERMEDGLQEIINEWMFAEAAAIPSFPRRGQIRIYGQASQPSNAQKAVDCALDFVKRHQEELEVIFGGRPYIDIFNLVRLSLRDDESRGEPMPHHADVDVILHLPLHVDAVNLAPAMVIAIIMMQWRLRCAPMGWSVVGKCDDEGTLHGYPTMEERYVDAAKRWEFKHLLLPRANAEHLLAVAQDLGDIVVACDNMLDMVRAIKDGGGFDTDPN